jgi:serine palmitoyltransferase
MAFLRFKNKKQAKQQPQSSSPTDADKNFIKSKSKSKGIDNLDVLVDNDNDNDNDSATLETSTIVSPSTSSAGISINDNENSSHDDDPNAPETKDDPYQDVRDRMEALSLHHRMVHAYHDASASSSDASQEFGEPVITFFAAWTTYLGYAVLIFVGHVRDFCAKIFRKGRYVPNQKETGCPADNDALYAPLLKSFENFYTKRLYHRIQDCFNRPLASSPGAKVNVLERISFDGNKTMQVLGQLHNLSEEEAKVFTEGKHYATVSGERVTRECLNLGSYNYLGFADDWNVTCRKGVMKSLDGLPVSMGSSRMECGTSKLHDQVEQIVSEFIGKEDAMVVNMGFNTNATTIPALMGHGDLIVSDELNHTSIVNGARTSRSAIRCFRHNDTKHLKEILQEAIVMGQPRTRRPWKRIMVIVEGIYSMEGEYCDLRNVVKVCKEYGAYVYLDEAHSIGAMGPTGRGCCEYTGVDPKDVDIMMGTFTKSFGGMGGYIAGSKEVVKFLRNKCAASSYHNSLSPIVCQQIISSFGVSLQDMMRSGVLLL